MFLELERSYIGKKMKYIGATDSQAMFCGSGDPREYFVVGQVYNVIAAQVGGWSTALQFKEVPGKTFNSVCFEFEG